MFLIYNPSVGPDKHFDVQVDYHLYRKLRERGALRDPDQSAAFHAFDDGRAFRSCGRAAGPGRAGHSALEFEAGDYRLGITVTDLLVAEIGVTRRHVHGDRFVSGSLALLMEAAMARLGRVLSAAAVGAGAAIVPISAHAQSDGTGRPVEPRAPPRPARPQHQTRPFPIDHSRARRVTERRRQRRARRPAARRDGVGRRRHCNGDAPSPISPAVSRSTRLPAGEYVVRAHWRASPHPAVKSVRVGRIEHGRSRSCSCGASTTLPPRAAPLTALPARPIVAAGFSSRRGRRPTTMRTVVEEGCASAYRNAWRLRHIKRSILKDRRTDHHLLTGDDPEIAAEESFFGRALGGAASSPRSSPTCRSTVKSIC